MICPQCGELTPPGPLDARKWPHASHAETPKLLRHPWSWIAQLLRGRLSRHTRSVTEEVCFEPRQIR